jgi:hypothetical protein
MFFFHLSTRLAALALLCTVAYQGGQYVKGTLEGVTSTMHLSLAPQS